jgi:hypothetical protein
MYGYVPGVAFGSESGPNLGQFQFRFQVSNHTPVANSSWNVEGHVDTKPPTTPAGFIVDYHSAVTVRVEWNPPDELHHRTFQVCYDTASPVTSADCNWDHLDDPDLGDASWPAAQPDIYANATTVMGLAPGATYYLTLRAVDAAGNTGPMTPQLGVTLRPSQRSWWTLRTGTNLVGFTSERMPTEMTMKELGASITENISFAGGKADRIRWFDEVPQLWREVTCASSCGSMGSWSGTDWTVAQGRGYWVSVSGLAGAQAYATPLGVEILAPVGLTLVEANKLQLITVPFSSGPGHSAFSLAKLIRQQNPGEFSMSSPQYVEILRWNQTTTSFESVLYYYDDFSGGWEYSTGPESDFEIRPGESVFIRLSSSDNAGDNIALNP